MYAAYPHKGADPERKGWIRGVTGDNLDARKAQARAAAERALLRPMPPSLTGSRACRSSYIVLGGRLRGYRVAIRLGAPHACTPRLAGKGATV